MIDKLTNINKSAFTCELKSNIFDDINKNALLFKNILKISK